MRKKPMVEECLETDFWAAKATDTNRLEGENNLGILLVALREEFRALKPTDDYVVAPLSMPFGRAAAADTTKRPDAGNTLKTK